jgi:hypothetical protein
MKTMIVNFDKSLFFLFSCLFFQVKDLKRVTEQFVYRQDKLTERKTDYKTGWVVEKFLNGRKLFLKGKKNDR